VKTKNRIIIMILMTNARVFCFVFSPPA
jgi:hypothetical protein